MLENLTAAPLNVGHLTLNNRLIHVATVGNYGKNGLPTEKQAAYYRRRAEGGVGLIVTEGFSVHPSSQPNPSVVHCYDPKAKQGMERIANVCHDFGVPILMQLWHVGRQQLWGPVGSPWGVSSLPDALSGVVPHVMTEREIQEIEQAFVEAAVTAQQCGFDGVELHGAHGYLITQFLSPWTNKRADHYGDRLYFLKTILQRIRKACGKDFAIAIKLSGSEFVQGGLDVQDTKSIVDDITSDGLVDLISINQGNFSLSLEKHVPDMHYPQAPFRDIIAQVRTAANGVPVAGIGRITDQTTANQLLKDGICDLIGMARGLISDPDLPRKWTGLSEEPVRNCISCNVCWGTIHSGKEMLCIQNSEVGSEETFVYTKAPHPKTIHVIGGGPAGMEAAWVAASRGHKVTLWEKEAFLGGQVRVLADLSGLQGYGDIIRYQQNQLSRYGVEVVCGREIGTQELAQMSNATVIVATGSVPQRYPQVLAPLNPVYPKQLNSLRTKSPAKVFVFDESGNYHAYGPLVELAQLGWSAVLITTRTELGMGLDYLSRIGLHRRLRQHSVEVLTGFDVAEVTDSEVILRDVFIGETRSLDRPNAVVWAGAREANDDLWRNEKIQFLPLRPIGDAYSPRNILSAIHEGNRIGRTV